MNTSNRRIEVSGIPIEVVRKDIKNLHLGVYPPNGRVRVAAPLRVSDSAIRLAVVTRLAWVRRQQRRFESQDRQSPREMVSGETHYFRGTRYRLDVVERDGPAIVSTRSNRRIELLVPPGCSREMRQKALDAWYRETLRSLITRLLEQWEDRIGLRASGWGIRKMKTRWGTCNSEAGRLWFNLELAKKSAACVELIVVHELVHLRCRHHDAEFLGEMDRLLPAWRAVRDELNRAPLGHFDWDY